MEKSAISGFIVVLLLFAVSPYVSKCFAETLYVDSKNGNDANPGTQEKPLRTIGKAAAIVNSKTKAGPTTIKIGPGIYNLTNSVIFENSRQYTEKDRLTIEASILPDDPQWKPFLMPVILSTENPGISEKLTETYSLKVKRSYVTIRGLKFLGNPLSNNWHACVERTGKDLDDLLITQCMFVGDKDSFNIYCAAIATGNRFVVDHCIFRNCHASTVYWDGLEGIGGKGCAMRYCIVDGSYISGVWTCQTAEDFEFHHNIITGCDYFWMRKPGDRMTYKLHDCIITNNNYYSGYGVETGATGQTGPEVTYKEKDVAKDGQVVIEKDKSKNSYLHVVPSTFGSNIGAGLFTKLACEIEPSSADIIRSAAAEGKLTYKLTELEEVKALLGPPVKELEKKWDGTEYLILVYPDVQVAFRRMSDGSVPFTLDEVAVNDKEYDISGGRQITLRNEDDLKKFDTWGGFWNVPGGVSLVNLDLRGHKTLLEEMRFDSRTKWPEPNKMPDGFDPARLLEEGKNPGLGIRSLHKQGIDGRGVGIAILDQVLLKDHVEYVDRIVRYEEIDMRRDLPPQMHGPPIVSIAVGKTCGVAPKAAVFYYAMMATTMPDNSIYCDIIDKIIQHNKNASASEQIRVISISTGTFAHQANFARWKETLRKADQHGILVVTCDQAFLNYGTLARIPNKDPDDPSSYRREGDFPGYTLLVPTNRTTASHNGPEVYTYWTNGGMSWAAPYIAGLAALAFQVNPDVQPQTIVEQLVKTATHTKAGPVVNPPGFIEAIKNTCKSPAVKSEQLMLC